MTSTKKVTVLGTTEDKMIEVYVRKHLLIEVKMKLVGTFTSTQQINLLKQLEQLQDEIDTLTKNTPTEHKGI